MVIISQKYYFITQILPENVKILTWICWGQNFENFRAPPTTSVYRELLEPPL